MGRRLPINKGKKLLYDIVLSHSFDDLEQELLALHLQNKKVCIVTDSHVEQLYLREVKIIFEKVAMSVESFSFQAGEENKTLSTVQALYQNLITKHFDRNDILVALGGGVVGDITGYTAATYLRGVSYLQIPTTLLAQVDSSIGGKTGVDFENYKNMVGAFYMPKLVYTNLSVLQDLEDRQFFAGMAEVMKAGLIKDSNFYSWLINNMYEISDKENDVLEEMVFRSCTIKKKIVEKDPFDKGDRALLNLGHTIGHAIEKELSFKLLHGECVALGCIAAAFISYKKDMISSDEFYEIRDMFVPFSLPITVENIDCNQILKTTKLDKKMSSGTLHFVLLSKIGKAILDTTVTDDEILAAINEIKYEEEHYE